MIPQIFYNGLSDDARSIVNAASSGKWMNKSPMEATTLLEELASQGYMGDEITLAKGKGMLELDSIHMLNAKVDALTKLMSKVQINSVEKSSSTCEMCGGPHSYDECHVSSSGEVNYLQGGFNHRNEPFSNTYNP